MAPAFLDRAFEVGGVEIGEAKADEATVADIATKFDLGGAGSALDGKLTNVAMRIFDPLAEDKRRFEEAQFDGAASLQDSNASFSGQFTSARKRVQLASVTGTHNLKTGNGALTFEPTLYLVDAGGTIVTRLDSVYDRVELRAALDRIA